MQISSKNPLLDALATAQVQSTPKTPPTSSVTKSFDQLDQTNFRPTNQEPVQSKAKTQTNQKETEEKLLSQDDLEEKLQTLLSQKQSGTDASPAPSLPRGSLLNILV